jgi:hypothetical protein
MDYTLIINELRAASLFDLFRLQAAIILQLDDPKRMDQVRRRLCPGMKISYFDKAQNRLVEATIREMRRTRLLVENLADRRAWLIPFCAVNLDAVPTDLRTEPGHKKLDRNSLKVGDQIGFRDRQSQDKYGQVIALNQKTATIITSDRQKWRVGYNLLFPVIEFTK